MDGGTIFDCSITLGTEAGSHLNADSLVLVASLLWGVPTTALSSKAGRFNENSVSKSSIHLRIYFLVHWCFLVLCFEWCSVFLRSLAKLGVNGHAIGA